MMIVFCGHFQAYRLILINVGGHKSIIAGGLDLSHAVDIVTAIQCMTVSVISYDKSPFLQSALLFYNSKRKKIIRAYTSSIL